MKKNYNKYICLFFIAVILFSLSIKSFVLKEGANNINGTISIREFGGPDNHKIYKTYKDQIWQAILKKKEAIYNNNHFEEYTYDISNNDPDKYYKFQINVENSVVSVECTKIQWEKFTIKIIKLLFTTIDAIMLLLEPNLHSEEGDFIIIQKKFDEIINKIDGIDGNVLAYNMPICENMINSHPNWLPEPNSLQKMSILEFWDKGFVWNILFSCLPIFKIKFNQYFSVSTGIFHDHCKVKQDIISFIMRSLNLYGNWTGSPSQIVTLHEQMFEICYQNAVILLTEFQTFKNTCDIRIATDEDRQRIGRLIAQISGHLETLSKQLYPGTIGTMSASTTSNMYRVINNPK